MLDNTKLFFPLNISFGLIILIFFFNRLFLPFGLQYSLLLTPFFLSALHFQGKLKDLRYIFIFLGLYSFIHLYNGVVFKDFLISNILMFTIVFYVAIFYFFYKKTNLIELFIEKIVQINFALTLIALISLISGKLTKVFWYEIPFTQGYKIIPRLKLFELEASHYSYALLPLFFYYFWKTLQNFNKKDFLLLSTILLSLLLSFSLGVIAVICFSLALVVLFKLKKLLVFKNTRNTLFFLFLFSCIVLLGLYLFFPENPLFFRIRNIFSGADTSGRGRTYEAFHIAWEVLKQNNSFFGIGLGQFKSIGRMTLIFFYKFMGIPEVARLPNCMAETLVVYGVFGFILKILLQIFLFVKFKVYKNIFQLSLFFSIFIYQFTGSYLFNGIEYIYWIIAFYPKLLFFNNLNYFKE